MNGVEWLVAGISSVASVWSIAKAVAARHEALVAVKGRRTR